MGTSVAQPESERRGPNLTYLASLADIASKGVAAIAIAVYACGFLTVSLHHSKYGFIGTNPFRPRVLAAGAWFLFFAAVPITIGIRYRAQPWGKVAKDLFFIWLACLGLSFPLSYLLFEFPEYFPASSPPKYSGVWTVAVIIAMFALLAYLHNSKKVPSFIYTSVSLLIVVFFVGAGAWALFVNNMFQSPAVSLWFFISIGVTIVETKSRNFKESGEWAKPFGTLFVMLLFFAQYYYPHLKASWGGGTPMKATIYFAKDSPLSPNKTVSVQLIEESDEGIYIVGPKETKAIFVPRNAVALIYFSDDPEKSSLLRNGK